MHLSRLLSVLLVELVFFFIVYLSTAQAQEFGLVKVTVAAVTRATAGLLVVLLLQEDTNGVIQHTKVALLGIVPISNAQGTINAITIASALDLVHCNSWYFLCAFCAGK